MHANSCARVQSCVDCSVRVYVLSLHFCIHHSNEEARSHRPLFAHGQDYQGSACAIVKTPRASFTQTYQSDVRNDRRGHVIQGFTCEGDGVCWQIAKSCACVLQLRERVSSKGSESIQYFRSRFDSSSVVGPHCLS